MEKYKNQIGGRIALLFGKGLMEKVVRLHNANNLHRTRMRGRNCCGENHGLNILARTRVARRCRTITRKRCGPTSPALRVVTRAATSKSSDLNFMRGRNIPAWVPDQQNCRSGWDRTYWSIVPLVAPNLRGPVTMRYWRRDSDPESQGMRIGRSRRLETNEKILKVRVGRRGLGGSEDLLIGDDSVVFAIFHVDVTRGGREDAATRPRMMKRAVTNVR